MNEEELEKYLKDNFTNYIRESIDSSIIFKYISEIETENNKLNNIIDEIIKLLEQPWNIDCINQNNYFLDKLKELKEGK